jgi:L-seryl-tRNA(Ser) seleniumtransferase
MNKNYIPSVNEFLEVYQNSKNLPHIDREILLKYIKSFIKNIRDTNFTPDPDKDTILNLFMDDISNKLNFQLKPVINASGILLHTNLGRSPISKSISDKVNLGYTNIELNLSTNKRDYRDDYLKKMLNIITGAEDVAVVNNNAAAVYLIVKALANKKEVIVSRGELIEIGGSFRIPDMLRDAGAKLVEVGTTNCTRVSDYENAINEKTGLIFKAHTSNYTISGHTASASLVELVTLSKKHNMPFIYDAGSGLLRKPALLSDTNEPDISECIDAGIDIVCFSGDKLLGASQAGIILGKTELLKKLKKHPLMRVLRVDKFTIASLFHTISLFLSEKSLTENNLVFAALSQTTETLHKKAKKLSKRLSDSGYTNQIFSATAQIGGGSLPELTLPSFEVQITTKNAEKLHRQLLTSETPILAILRERKLYLNVFAMTDEEIDSFRLFPSKLE